MPPSIRATLSAFANTRGGVLILGLDESEGFAASGVREPAKMAGDLASWCSTEMEPPLRPLIRVHQIEGVSLVVAEIPELEQARKPCFYRGAGLTQGSYVRVADGDRRLTGYEVVSGGAGAVGGPGGGVGAGRYGVGLAFGARSR